MNKKARAAVATVLKALTSGWDLVDYAPEIDFLVLFNENGDELDFYPKKSLLGIMERCRTD